MSTKIHTNPDKKLASELRGKCCGRVSATRIASTSWMQTECESNNLIAYLPIGARTSLVVHYPHVIYYRAYPEPIFCIDDTEDVISNIFAR